MQANDFQQRFSAIDQLVQDAGDRCARAQDVPQSVITIIEQLVAITEEARGQVNGAEKPQFAQIVDGLTKPVDQAMQAIHENRGLDTALREAVRQLQDRLSQLRHELY